VEGLKEGDRVVVDNVLKVVPGKPVKIGEPKAGTPDKAQAPQKTEAKKK
jgi:hypothetical protein